MLIDPGDLSGKSKVSHLDCGLLGVGKEYVFGFDITMDQEVIMLKVKKAIVS